MKTNPKTSSTSGARQVKKRRVRQCKTCLDAMRTERRKANPEKYAEQQRKYRAADKEKAKSRARKHYADHKEKILARLKRKRDSLRLEMITAYGGACECCGENHPIFLTLDHINNNGAQHRKILSNGYSRSGNGKVIQQLKSLGWPKENYRLLCYNCNCGRHRNNGTCPHEEENFSDSAPHTCQPSLGSLPNNSNLDPGHNDSTNS